MKNVKPVIVCSVLLLVVSNCLVQAESYKSGIGIFVKEIHGIDRTGHPVRVTVPIARGDLNDVNHMQLTLNSVEVEASYRSMVDWDDGSVQWVAIDFFADVDANETTRYDLKYGPGVSHQNYSGMSVSSVSGGYEVDTGIIKVKVGDFTNVTGIKGLYYDTDDDGSYADETNLMKGSSDCDSIVLSSNGGTLYRNTDGGSPTVTIVEKNNIFTEIAITDMSGGNFDFRANYIFYKDRSYIEKVTYIDYDGSNINLCMIRSADYKFSSYLASNTTITSYNTAVDSFTPNSGYHYYWYMSDPNPETIKFLTYNGNTSAGSSTWFTSSTTNDPNTTTGELDMPAYFVDASSSTNNIGVAVSTLMHEWGMDADFHCEYQSSSVALAVQPHGTESTRAPSVYNDQWKWYDGLAKTFSSWIYVHSGGYDSDVKDTSVSLYKKLRALPDSDYTMETNAFGLGQPNPDFEYEQWLEPIRRWVDYHQLDIEEYSMHEDTDYNPEEIFDVHGLQSGEGWHGFSAVTGLPSGGRDRMPQPFKHWVIEAYRSGDIKLLEDTLEKAQAEADYAHIHRGTSKGSIRYHKYWQSFPSTDYSCRGFGYYYAYLATANPYFLECWENELEFQYDYVYDTPEGWGTRESIRRGGYGMENFALGYWYFDDSRYLNAANRIFNSIINVTRQEGDVREAELCSPWITAIKLEGLIECYLVDPTPEKYRYLQRLADFLITTQNADGSFEYRFDIWKSGSGSVTAAKDFLRMYEITGLIRYYTAAMRAINWSLNTINRTGVSNIRISDVIMTRIDPTQAGNGTTANSEIFTACAHLSALARRESLPFVVKVDVTIGGSESDTYGLNSIDEIGTDYIKLTINSPDSSGNITVGGLSTSTQFKIDNEGSVSYLNTDSSGVLSFTTATSGQRVIGITKDGMPPLPIVLDTPNVYGGRDFSWAPLGYGSNSFAFNSRRSGHYQICVMDTDGTNFNQLTSSNLWHSNPSWSPDGNTIAYLKQGSYWDKNIFICNPDGSGHTFLTDLNEYELYTPRWRYDSGKILFSYSDYYGNNVAVMDPDGTNIDLLTSDTDSTCPVWSPDGSKIVYSKYVGSSPAQNELHIMDADGSNDQIIRSASHYNSKYMVWSPTGSRILIMIMNDSGIYDIWSIKPDGSDQIRLTFEGGRHPAYSTDGTRITYCRDDTIWIMNADGTEKFQISASGEYGDYPRFLPDSNDVVAFMKYRLDANLSEYTADYSEIQIVGLGCGGPGTIYLPGDLNTDCYTDFNDLDILVGEWLQESDPNTYEPQPVYNESFDTDPCWSYQGTWTPDSIYWEDNATHGGIVNAKLYRINTGTSWYYTTDLATVIGKPLDNTWDWTLSFDLYQEYGNPVYPYVGLAGDDFIGDGAVREPQYWIGYRIYPASNRAGRFYCDIPGTGNTYSDIANNIYAEDEWYTVEISYDATSSELYYRVIVNGGDAFTWTKTVTGSFSFNTFAIWDYYNTSSFASTLQYLDNLVITAPGELMQCGDPGTIYLDSDINEDCDVNLEDYAWFAIDWLRCTIPDNVDCD